MIKYQDSCKKTLRHNLEAPNICNMICQDQLYKYLFGIIIPMIKIHEYESIKTNNINCIP